MSQNSKNKELCSLSVTINISFEFTDSIALYLSLYFIDSFQRASELLSTALRATSISKSSNHTSVNEVQLLQQSLQDKSKVEAELRKRLQAKDEELEKIKSLAKVKDSDRKRLQDDLEIRDKQCEALTSTVRKYERQNVVNAVNKSNTTSNQDGASTSSEISGGSSAANRIEQESKLSALDMELTECRQELGKQAKSHATRLQEVQEACQMKLKELKRLHGVAMQQIQAESKKQIEDLKAQLALQSRQSQLTLQAAQQSVVNEKITTLESQVKKLQEDLQLSKGAYERLKCDKEYLQEDLSQAKEEMRSMENEIQTINNNWRNDVKRMEDLNEEIARLKQEVLQHMSRASSRAASRLSNRNEIQDQTNNVNLTNTVFPDGSFMQVMEENVSKLSERLRLRELEVNSLKKTVQDQCTERGELMRQVAILKVTIDEYRKKEPTSNEFILPSPNSSTTTESRILSSSSGPGQRPDSDALRDSSLNDHSLHRSSLHKQRPGFAQGRSKAFNYKSRRQILR